MKRKAKLYLIYQSVCTVHRNPFYRVYSNLILQVLPPHHIFIKVTLSFAFLNFMQLLCCHDRKHDISSLYLILSYATESSKLERKHSDFLFLKNHFYITAIDLLNSVNLVCLNINLRSLLCSWF